MQMQLYTLSLDSCDSDIGASEILDITFASGRKEVGLG